MNSSKQHNTQHCDAHHIAPSHNQRWTADAAEGRVTHTHRFHVAFHISSRSPDFALARFPFHPPLVLFPALSLSLSLSLLHCCCFSLPAARPLPSLHSFTRRSPAAAAWRSTSSVPAAVVPFGASNKLRPNRSIHFQSTMSARDRDRIEALGKLELSLAGAALIFFACAGLDLASAPAAPKPDPPLQPRGLSLCVRV